ncbi:MAG: Nif3-like dinuclear metal center hexameric protein [Acidimicrobiia bacterium]
MATVSEVLSSLDQAAPVVTAASWDPAGLQLGDATDQVGTIAVCHEVTEEVVEEVESIQPDLVVTYHPLLFRPTTRLVAGPNAAGRAWRLVRAGVALAVTHTSFDSAPGGTADALATALGLVDVVAFGAAGPAPSHKVVTFVPADAVDAVRSAMADAGGGRIGNYTGCSFRGQGVGAFEAREGASPAVGTRGVNEVEEVRLEMIVSQSSLDRVVAALVASHPYEEPGYDVYETVSNSRFIGRIGRHDGTLDDLVALVTSRLGGDGLRVTPGSSTADRVAVLPGSGSSFAGAARAAGADVLVTGDVDHHRAIQARDGGMSIVDPGHGPSERPGMAALFETVRRVCPDATVLDLTGHDPTPWR